MHKDTDFYCSCIRTASCNYCLTVDSLMLDPSGMAWYDWCARLDSLIDEVVQDNSLFLSELKVLINENAD